MKYFIRGIIASILLVSLTLGGFVTDFLVLYFLAIPPMLYMYYCLFKVIIAIIKAMADHGDTTALKEVAKVYYKNGKKKRQETCMKTLRVKGT